MIPLHLATACTQVSIEKKYVSFYINIEVSDPDQAFSTQLFSNTNPLGVWLLNLYI